MNYFQSKEVSLAIEEIGSTSELIPAPVNMSRSFVSQSEHRIRQTYKSQIIRFIETTKWHDLESN